MSVAIKIFRVVQLISIIAFGSTLIWFFCTRRACEVGKDSWYECRAENDAKWLAVMIVQAPALICFGISRAISKASK